MLYCILQVFPIAGYFPHFCESRRSHKERITLQVPEGAHTLQVRLLAPALTDCLIRLARPAGQKVGVLAVDPSSPISGGAILGDRIRMNRFALDQDVFIRSSMP